jgi:hypothetical protein
VERAAALAGGPVTIDLDTTEVYGRKECGVACNHRRQWVGRPHVAAWVEAEIVLAADLGDGTDARRVTRAGSAATCAGQEDGHRPKAIGHAVNHLELSAQGKSS